MQMIITKDDTPRLTGKFIIQLDNDSPYPVLAKQPSFWLEKRISFVVSLKEKQIAMTGFYYDHGIYTVDEFVEYFNQAGESRHHRLLTSDELGWLFGEMKKRNY